MTIPSSGTISHTMIQNEFGGDYPIQLEEYYGAAPGIPQSGQISNTDFYGTTRIFETVITVGETINGGWAIRRGFGQADKTTFLHPEAGQSYAAFGSATVTNYVVGGYDLYGIHAGGDLNNPNSKWIVITSSNLYGAAGNWRRVRSRIVGTSTWIDMPRELYSAYSYNSLGYGIIVFSVVNNYGGDPVYETHKLLYTLGAQIEIQFD